MNKYKNICCHEVSQQIIQSLFRGDFLDKHKRIKVKNTKLINKLMTKLNIDMRRKYMVIVFCLTMFFSTLNCN